MTLYENTTNEKTAAGRWVDYQRKTLEDIEEFCGWVFLGTLIDEALNTEYYANPHPFLSDEYRKTQREYLCSFDQALEVAAFKIGGRISEVLMLHADNIKDEGDFLRITGMPVLKRLKKTRTIIDTLKEIPPDGVVPKGYKYAHSLGTFIKIRWDTDPVIGVREDFPIPRWEPFTDILLDWVDQAELGAGGFRWLFPTSYEVTRIEKPGIQKWINEKFNLETRAWISPERAYQKVRTIGERLEHHIWDHWFRSMRASQLARDYEFREPDLNRFFGWAGGWVTQQKSMASRYAKSGYHDLVKLMKDGKDRVPKQPSLFH